MRERHEGLVRLYKAISNDGWNRVDDMAIERQPEIVSNFEPQQ